MKYCKQERGILGSTTEWDLIVIGGGATGLGTALDSASRGFKTLLLEQSDFAKGTSSRSTKLVHGGVRYLAQGDISLVYQALRERGLLQVNAAHLVSKEEFIIPCFSWFSVAKYLAGLKMYDWLSGKYSFGRSKFLSRKEVCAKIPGLDDKGLIGGISYFDGKFDDARLAVNIAQTCMEQGGTVLNYVKVTGLLKDENGKISGVSAFDSITETKHKLYAKAVVNATGVFVDDILQMNIPNAEKLVRPSQGVHVVLNSSFLNSDSALMIPETSDKRVLFAVPWHSRLLVGTTDTPIESHSLEPRALDQEIDFILSTASQYFKTEVTKKDVLSVFAGLRPLAAPGKNDTNSTKEISRDHKLIVSDSGLVTITGGKWTTYRKMSEETVNQVIRTANLEDRKCVTKELRIHSSEVSSSKSHLKIYGTDRPFIEELVNENPEWNAKLHPHFPNIKAEIVWAVRNEMAYTVEDVLARRLRILFVDVRAAMEMSRDVAKLMAAELNKGADWIEDQVREFKAIANQYLLEPQIETEEILLTK
ncbi:glycerol-3-phosphate dehydrogenase/oxidase [Daejeonella lutea]|uniref:Glycerol-3-phosphate dehydrogenase n=1 Tax=Daejeonella lutea TaxID=572036 RepID=A0A1T5BBC6_9SPHI|nr:glycerol-3-phosphate dehydrogenase/oxidase [Daejeonella lutea]SKB44594.1 glycerol-3-phosphate dehydrogenase [Daejeonella lutea]